MAKKEATVSLIDTFSEFKDLKNIDRTTMVSVLEESFRSVIAKMFGTDENYDVIVNPDKGDFEIWRNREVVADDELTNPNMQISLTEARKIDASYEVGEEVTDEVIFEKFGRRAILNLRQTLASKILELEKTVYTISILIRSVRLLLLKFIRSGRRKFCCSMTRVMNCCFRRLSRFRVTFIVKEKPYVLLWHG